MNERLIVSGTGGQGVQFVGKFVCWYALLKDLNVSFIPSYGAEMRGGSTSAQIVISQQQIHFPVVTKADTIILLDRPGIEKYVSFHTENTEIIYNCDIINGDIINEIYPKTSNILGLKAQDISKSFGENAPVNIPFIYSFLKRKDVYTKELINCTLEKILEGKEKFISYNNDYFNYLEKTADKLYA